MNINERNEIVKLIEPNILPNTVELEVKVTEDVKLIGENEVLEISEDIDMSLENLDMVSDDNEEVETEYDFSTLNKLELVEILEETVQDTDVVKIKDKVASIKFNFLRICNEENEEDADYQHAGYGLGMRKRGNGRQKTVFGRRMEKSVIHN